MFQFVVTVLTTIALAVHALIGCCWHHEHQDAHECASHQFASEHHGHDSSMHDEEESEEHDSDNHSSHCDRSRCVFVRSVESNSMASPLASSELPFNTRILADIISPRHLKAFRTDKFWDAWAAQEPLFLRRQVWLI